MDTALGLQANQATTYTQTEVDNALAPNPTTAYVDALLSLKANQATIYQVRRRYSAGRNANQVAT